MSQNILLTKTNIKKLGLWKIFIPFPSCLFEIRTFLFEISYLFTHLNNLYLDHNKTFRHQVNIRVGQILFYNISKINTA